MRRELFSAQLLDDATDAQVQRDGISVVEAAIRLARAATSQQAAAALDNVFQEM